MSRPSRRAIVQGALAAGGLGRVVDLRLGDEHGKLTFENGWNIKPDLIVEMPKPFELPARGTLLSAMVDAHAHIDKNYTVREVGAAQGNLFAAIERMAADPPPLGLTVEPELVASDDLRPSPRTLAADG